ncbi:arrestin domain-containing protein 17-like [Plodia interpunctella]|uniref:arrestin domain-containing protein 17-like n=1 Tax=Plodia interpunctella TaxID=58824 RepID=UPI002367A155|nr:arrestin domain-containing protein 17-like [Plodia interpunctella]
MGFDNARIVLDSPNNTYYAGQTLNGRLLFSSDKVKKFRGIYVHMRGYCKVHWTSREHNPHSHSEHDRHRTVNHDSYEDYFDHKIYLSGSSSGDHQLPAGQHDLPFSIRIPDNCPSAIEGEYGYVRYELKVVVDRAFKTDQELSAPLKILSPLDLNMVPKAREPINIKMEDSYCCWCVNAGSSETLLELPSSGYCPGQVIPVAVQCINRSTEEIDIKVALKKEITFTARSAPGTKHEKSKILEEKRGPVPPHLTKSWTIELVVPEMDVHNLRNCSFISVEYELKITVSPDGCHDDNEDSCNLIFGSIPLGGTQIIQNPHTITQSQAYSQAITQQPYPSPYLQYPNATPNPPHTGFQTNNYPPNPHLTSPFPPNPYPPSPQSIPLQTSPNPMAHNQPSPYPQSPYPPHGGLSSYPNNQGPYPPGPQGPNSPYPPGPQGPNSPYPPGPQGPNSPYPLGPQGPSSPYPAAFTGFTRGAEQGARAPLLPLPKPGSTASPYAPSAPVPSTPDDATKPLMMDGDLDKSQPAYNPNV